MSTLHDLVQNDYDPQAETSASILPLLGRAEVTCANNWGTSPAVRHEAKKSFLTPSLKGALILHKELETKFTAPRLRVADG